MNKKYVDKEIDEEIDFFYSEMLSNLEEEDKGEVFDN